MKNYREVKIGPYSVYAIAKKNGFEGTEEEWLESLKPPAVDPTLSKEGKAADAKVTGDTLATKAVIDDTTVGTDAWSSKHIVDMLCPPLEETGNPVQFYPVAGYPLGVKAEWEPTQEGTGEPSPDNIRPIKGRDSVTVNRADGLRAWKLVTLDGTEKWNAVGSGDVLYFQCTAISIGTRVLSKDDCCTTFPVASISGSNTVQGVSGWKTSLYLRWSTFSDVGTLKSYLAAQYAAGTPVQVCYKLAEPVVVPDANGIFFSEQPAQGGSGDPSPDNIRPILLNNAVQVGQTTTITLPRTIYGGTVDAVSGEGQETWKIYDNFNSHSINEGATEAGWVQSEDAVAWYTSRLQPALNKPKVLSNVFHTISSIVTTAVPYTMGANANYVAFRLPRSVAATEDDVKRWLIANDVKIALEIKDQTPFTATGAQPIPALSGVNTVLTDADKLTVTGRADPIKRIIDLEDAVASMI